MSGISGMSGMSRMCWRSGRSWMSGMSWMSGRSGMSGMSGMWRKYIWLREEKKGAWRKPFLSLIDMTWFRVRPGPSVWPGDGQREQRKDQDEEEAWHGQEGGWYWGPEPGWSLWVRRSDRLAHDTSQELLANPDLFVALHGIGQHILACKSSTVGHYCEWNE